MRHTPEGNDRSESEMSSGNNTTALEFSVGRAACKKSENTCFTSKGQNSDVCSVNMYFTEVFKFTEPKV